MLNKFRQIFESSHSIESLNLQLKEILAELKITTYAFTYYAYHPHSKNKLIYDNCSANFAPWHKHYIEESYAIVDSTMSKTYTSTLPTFWDLQLQLAAAQTSKEKQMRLDSIDFGAEKGLSIPIHGANEDFAVLLLVQMRQEHCLDNWQIVQDQLMLLAHCYFAYLKKLIVTEIDNQNKYQLSQREIQCLLLTAQRQTVKNIADTLEISERTVNFHIQSANKKLGAENKYQSIAKALAKGIINL